MILHYLFAVSCFEVVITHWASELTPFILNFFQVKIKVVEVTFYKNCVVEFSNTCWACMKTIWLCIAGILYDHNYHM